MPSPQVYPFSDTLDPRRTLHRRMATEGEAQPTPLAVAQVASAPASASRFGRPFSPEDQARQKQALIDLLRRRDASQ